MNLRHPRRAEQNIDNTKQQPSKESAVQQRKRSKGSKVKKVVSNKSQKTTDSAVQPPSRSKGNKRTPLRKEKTTNVNPLPHRIEILEILDVDSSSVQDSDNKNTGYIAGDDRNMQAEPPSDNDIIIPNHIRSNTAEYRSRRKRATDLARFHTFSAKKQNKILRAYGPRQLPLEGEEDNDLPIGPVIAVDINGAKEAERLYSTIRPAHYNFFSNPSSIRPAQYPVAQDTGS